MARRKKDRWCGERAGGSLIYDIKAIPTTYAGVNFRSRLEARWAAFFDLANIEWEYEPLDLEGWCPDFLLRLKLCNVLCEVKPSDLISAMDLVTERYLRGEEAVIELPEYQKARLHAYKHQVCLLGAAPLLDRTCYPIGLPLDPPRHAKYSNDDIIDALDVHRSDAMWREAGNIIQWIPATADEPSIRSIVDRAMKKAA